MNILWTEKRPAGDTDKKWYCCSSDSNGSHFIAGVYGGRLYVSDDIGETWTEVQPLGNTDQEWISCSSDWDGSHLVAGTNEGRVFVSDDSGATWTERKPDGVTNEEFYCCASNGDGTIILAGEKEGRIYLSDDSGATWNEIQPAGDRDMLWQFALMSENGERMVMNAKFPTFPRNPCYYVSLDYGVTWERCETYPGNIDMWTVRDEDGNKVDQDSDGARLGRLTLYSHSTKQVLEIQPAGDVNKNWKNMFAGADGVTRIAIECNGRLYVGIDVEGALYVKESKPTTSFIQESKPTTSFINEEKSKDIKNIA